ncbi:MFS transporter [Sphingomonas canadensis]|uniref:MFS transporter n=1 Tax=Sphingomonas canadensis TaxID=1219257 RepID=A0ABW3H3C2_9SPHN|nr:MFS transporter [Sphingomonas canadensis]MCW3835615.1 MFS transporter [Sphingomonas canadensis]
MAPASHAPDSGAVPSPLSIPIFRAVWAANLAANLGGMIQSVGAAWTMVALAGSPQLVALVPVSISLPIVLLALLSGAVADNFNRRHVMLAAQGFLFCVSIGLALCSWFGLLSPWLLLGFTFLVGCGTALNSPSWHTSVSEMVPRAALHSAVALNSMAFNIARTLGPAIGGVIVATLGATAAFLVNAVSYFWLAAVLLRWRPATPERTTPREPIRAAMAAGVRYVAMSPHLTMVLGRTLLFGSGLAGVSALLPVIARDLMGGGPSTFGMMLGAFGLGAVGGAAASGRLRRRFSNETIVRLASLALVLSTAAVGVSRNMVFTLPALMLGGASWLLALSTFNATMQLAAPRWVVARALSVYQMCAFGGLAAGSWGFGWVAEHHGIVTAIFAAAGWQAVSALVGLRMPLPKVDDLNLDPLRDWREPETSVPVEPRSGPVVVLIEYRIAPGDVPAFLAAMSERRRVRRRDGAYGWSLLHDLSDAELWLERYHVPTWVDYVRHNQRRTHADAANFARILEYHRGEERPRVRRMLEVETGPPPRDTGPHELPGTV